MGRRAIVQEGHGRFFSLDRLVVKEGRMVSRVGWEQYPQPAGGASSRGERVSSCLVRSSSVDKFRMHDLL